MLYPNTGGTMPSVKKDQGGISPYNAQTDPVRNIYGANINCTGAKSNGTLMETVMPGSPSF